MTKPIVSKSLSLPNLGTLRDLLNLLASLCDLSNPFASLADLRTALELLQNFSATMGVDSRWLTWLQIIHDNPQLLNLILAAGQYLESVVEPTQPQSSASLHRVNRNASAALTLNWTSLLALIGEIVQLLEQLWPNQ